MRAISLIQAVNKGQTKENSYRLEEIPAPEFMAGHVHIQVAYAGVNRADLLQKQGRYPLPADPHAIPGMEVAGIVIACGKGVTRFKPGDKICALVSEGAFAEVACVDAAHVLPVPASLSLEQAAAMPEACFTVWISLVWQAQLKKDESVLIHGGASGIGTVGIQLAKHLGARVFTTAGSQEKCSLCETLGAEKSVLYREEDFVAVLRGLTGEKGVDVILDMVGGDYFDRNLQLLAPGGRLAIIAFLKGAKVAANLAPILLKRLTILGSTLRSRPAHEKAQLAQEIEKGFWPAVAEGRVKPVIDTVFPLDEAEKALERMDQGLNIGKILLKM